ncbi:hypothetical protein D8B26_002146 [Coccidioides posadasii str. Silveira]|uniref:Uncharacterized protein n=2 Tax=Coccidioides posadasii TaxID=199306 RepID=E9CV54_COCPS|nr:conserved hypothetical protein [Coccidioides posadasii str. Silveira]KMM65521.1 hypothetical protein CPAG_01870 [Coccidioides posadasii RMSCC 3488]QVM07446.1 hypothetical protein D8B26_002146 [Coccidioides posadasii str. Silveira]TPX26123.1 hypothetical protein DIZ76_011584 [Coccidioides immitis]
MPDPPPSGGPRTGISSKAATRRGGAGAEPTPATNVDHDGGPHSHQLDASQSEAVQESARRHHGHSETRWASKFASLQDQKKHGEEMHGYEGGHPVPKERSFAEQKPGSKSLAGQFMEKFR